MGWARRRPEGSDLRRRRGLLWCGGAETLTVIGFNVEAKQPSSPPSWDSTIDTVAATVRAAPKADVWGFSEVPNKDWAGKLKEAAGSNYWYLWGESGSSDHLVIVFNKDTLEQVGTVRELQDPAYTGRKPLVAKFKVKSTGKTFLFMVNHLTRGNSTTEYRRHQQAETLNEWAREVDSPVIAVGDYNFDLDLRKQQGKWLLTGELDLGLHNMTKAGRWIWVQPESFMPT